MHLAESGVFMEFSEKFLYHIWDAQHLKNEMFTASKKKISVMFPGRWNTDSGPDFKDAIIKINENILRGDIEIELEAYNWKVHEHHENPEFNNVIIIVAYQHEGLDYRCITENGNPVEILSIENYLDQDIEKLIAKYEDNTPTRKKQCGLFPLMKEKDFICKFTDLGRDRFEKKVKRFAAEHYFCDFDQLLYQGIFESLGYSKNKYQMLQLAMSIPFKKLITHFDNGMTKDELIALYLCSSRLIEYLPSSIPADLKTKWIAIYHNSSLPKPTYQVKWQLFRLRPANHPAIRILQISDFIYDCLSYSIMNSVLKIFSLPGSDFDLKQISNNLRKKFAEKTEYLPEKFKLGTSRLEVMFINIILPVSMVYAREKGYGELEKAILQIYSEFPGLPDNYISDFLFQYMTDWQQRLVRHSAIVQQGIIAHYFEKCKFHNCEDCS